MSNNARPASHGYIMLVDDNPANLKLLEDMLLQHGYETRSFPRGRLALAAAAEESPDLVLLDVNMPEMNGYEVCQKLKEDPQLREIPVIFLSALSEVEDKVKALHCGGVDYISKPFHFEEVRARVETHIALRRAKWVEHDLLERTLGGSVKILWELMQLLSPCLATRTHAIRNIVLWTARKMKMTDLWQMELAGTLCLLGCICIPEEVFDRAYAGGTLSPDEKRMFQAHPERGASLLGNIPRLEPVAGMIRNQLTPEADRSADERVRLGARILRVAMELDRGIMRGDPTAEVLATLRTSGRFDKVLLDSLADYEPAQEEFDVRTVPVRALRTGMVLNSDFYSKDGHFLILKEGTTLSATWIARLENFILSRGGGEQLVRVRVPRASGVPESAAH
jgi:DNA-binding response OmpR family regulator